MVGGEHSLKISAI